MIKLSILFLSLFSVHFFNANAQNALPIDSIQEQARSLKKKFVNEDPVKDAQYFTDFLYFLEQQKNIQSLPDRQKQLEELQVEVMLAKMGRVHSTYAMMDSIEAYKKKINKLTNDPVYLAKMHNISGWAYKQSNSFSKALENYYAALDLIHEMTDEGSKIEGFKTSKLMIGLLLEIQSYHHAGLLLKNAKLNLENFKSHPEYSMHRDQCLLMEAVLNLNIQQPQQALEVLDLITNKKRYQYFNLKQKAYFDLGELEKSKLYLEQAGASLNDKSNLNHKLTTNYWYYKLKLCIAQKDLQELEPTFETFKQILEESSISIQPEFYELVHAYYKLKGDIPKAYEYYLKANDLRIKNEAFNTKQRIEVDGFMLTRDQKVNLLQTDLIDKEQLIASNTKLFILVTLVGLLAVGLLFTLFYYHRRKKTMALQYQIDSANHILKAKAEYLENVTHEIRTPITIVNGYLSMLQQYAMQPQKVRAYSELGKQSVSQLLNALNNYLRLFNSDDSTHNPSFNQNEAKPQAIIQPIRELIATFYPLAVLGNIKLFFKTNIKEDQEATVDLLNIKNVMSNLIANALKYTHAGGQVFIAVNYKPHVLHIQVKDTGIGMSPNDVARIFSRFYQSHETASTTTGFGIGLSIVKELVNQLGGHINVKSTLNEGSSFTIEIPLNKTEQLETQPEANVEYQALDPLPAINDEPEDMEQGNRPKILIVRLRKNSVKNR